MRKFIIAAIFSVVPLADAVACAPEAPTHNAYMFSVFRRERMQSPFAEDMNNWWKAYADDLKSDASQYYRMNADTLQAIARQRGDRQMLEYMRWLDAYLEVSDGVSMDTWDYPTREELARRDSTLHAMLDAAQAYKGRKMREQFALLTMRANMLLGRDKANMLYWTATASKLPRGVWRDMCRNIYARALLNSGLRRAACEVYAEQGDMRSISWCMRGYRNLAGIKKVYAEEPNSFTLLYLVQEFVNSLQETLDSYTDGQVDTAWVKDKGRRPVFAADARAFVGFVDGVLKEKKTASPCLWQSAAAMVQYLLADYQDAARRADEAVGMKGSRRMKDNARCIRLLAQAATAPLGGDFSAWLTDEFRWLDRKIEEERGHSQAYSNHYTDVKERIAYLVLAPRYHAAGLHSVENALYGMMEENQLDFETDGKHAEPDFIWQGDWPWNRDYAAWNEYFAVLSDESADSLAAYYSWLTSAKTDVFEHYVAQQVYQNKDYYNDLIGTRYIAEGRFSDAQTYLERVPLDYLPKQNISWYMANRSYMSPRWFVRQLPNDAETDGPGKATPRENLKVKFCKDMLQMQSQYNLAPGGEQRDIRAYELATRFYQASCYGDCWFLTHYAKSVNDSARAGELDFAQKARELLAESSRSSNLQIQYESLYALAYTDTDPWFAASYDSEYNVIITPRPMSSQYKALEALSRFAKEHPQDVDEHTTKCDVLRRFNTHPSPPEGRELDGLGML